MFFRKKKISASNHQTPKATFKRRLPKRRRTPGKTLTVKNDPPTKISERHRRQDFRRKSFFGKLKRSTLFILIVSTIFYITYTLFLSSALTIHQIKVIENDISVSSHAIGKLLKDFEGSNLLLFNGNEIEPYLHKQYPEYETLKITKSLPDTLTIILKTYPVVAKLIVNPDKENEQQFLLTRAGQIAEYNEEILSEQELREIKMESEQSLQLGANVMDQNKLAFILEAIQGFEDRFGMIVKSAEYHDTARETHLLTERNFYVWLDMTTDLDEQFNKLKKSLPRLDIYNMNLQYIDLRISGANGEKIIFKRS